MVSPANRNSSRRTREYSVWSASTDMIFSSSSHLPRRSMNHSQSSDPATLSPELGDARQLCMNWNFRTSAVTITRWLGRLPQDLPHNRSVRVVGKMCAYAKDTQKLDLPSVYRISCSVFLSTRASTSDHALDVREDWDICAPVLTVSKAFIRGKGRTADGARASVASGNMLSH